MKRILSFTKANTVLIIAIIAAVISMFLVPPDSEYLGYFDYKTLSSLFMTLAIICALRNVLFFRILARKIVQKFKNTRSAILALTLVTFFFSMLIANDMALITFLPLACIVLKSTGKEKYMCFAFVMCNIAANLGGMLTPFGNPQNLYLYTFFSIGTGELMLTMLPYFIVSLVMLVTLCLFVKKEALEFVSDIPLLFNKKKTTVYALTFAFVLLIIFRLIPFWVGLIVVPVVLLIFDRKALLDVDYGLLLTFVMFFIFAGNFSRLPAVNAFLSGLMEKSAFFTGLISCQFISNVPSAILLSHYTMDYKSLLVAVNIGGIGTIISSLASLITLKEFGKSSDKSKGYYLLRFTGLNLLFLIVLTGVYLIINFF